MVRGNGVSAPLLELQNLVTCAELVVSCALQRKESRGLHYNMDYPQVRWRGTGIVFHHQHFFLRQPIPLPVDMA